jgi:hypothetical protein
VTPTTAAPGRAGLSRGRGRGVRRRRSWIAGTLSIGLVVALIVLAIVKLDPAAVLSSLTSVAGGWVVLAVGLMATAFLARAESWFAVIRAAVPDAPVGRLAVLRALLIGLATPGCCRARRRLMCSPARGALRRVLGGHSDGPGSRAGTRRDLQPGDERERGGMRIRDPRRDRRARERGHLAVVQVGIR